MNFHCQLENDHRIVRFLKGLYIDTISVFLNGFILKKSKPWNSSLFAPVVKSCRQDYIENHNESSAQDFQKRLLDSEIPIPLQDIRCLGWAWMVPGGFCYGDVWGDIYERYHDTFVVDNAKHHQGEITRLHKGSVPIIANLDGLGLFHSMFPRMEEWSIYVNIIIYSCT